MFTLKSFSPDDVLLGTFYVDFCLTLEDTQNIRENIFSFVEVLQSLNTPGFLLQI